MPESGIVWQVHFFAPGAPGGVVDISLDDGTGKQWHAKLRAWDAGAQLTWNQAPVLAGEIIGNLAMFKANVIYWPLADLDGAALRADFAAL